MQITYEGPAPIAGLFAQLLRDEGLDVSFEAPVEQRSAGQAAVHVVMYIADKAGDAVIGAALTAAITKLKSRFPKTKVTNAAGKEIHPTSSDESHSNVARE